MIFDNDIEKCITALKANGLILYPTDTVWGLGCDATNEIAVKKIYQLKKRADEKSMIILLATAEDLSNYVKKLPKNIFEYLKKLSKPTTLIYDGAKNLASNLINQDGSIAIRIVQDDFCKTLINQMEKPIVSTSANISGTTTPKIYKEISTEIKNGVDYIVQHRKTEISLNTPSVIIKYNIDGSIKVIRP